MSNGRRRAVLIGSSRFDKDPENLSQLNCPENDVDGMHEILSAPELGAFEDVHVFKNANRDDVMRRIEGSLRIAGSADQVLIYYSGHGKTDMLGRLYLATTDTEVQNLVTTSIPVEILRMMIETSSCRKIILILDCCYAGAGGRSFTKGSVDEKLQELARGNGVYILTASTASQTAQESDNYGLLTKHIIFGIKQGAAANKDGNVSMDDLYDYVYTNVTSEGYQEPMRWALNVKGHDLLIARSSGVWIREQLTKKVIELRSYLPSKIFRKALEVVEDRQVPLYDLVFKLYREELTVGRFIDEWNSAEKHPEPDERRIQRNPRRIDAAVPSNTEVGRKIDLVVQVRFPDSPQLGIEDWPLKHTPASVEGGGAITDLAFPINPKTREVGTSRLKVRVIAPDFKIEGATEKVLEVPPDKYSSKLTFLLSAKKLGNCRINVEIYDATPDYLGSIPIETAVGGSPVAPSVNIANFFFVVTTNPFLAHISGDRKVTVGGDIGGSLIVTGDGNEITIEEKRLNEEKIRKEQQIAEEKRKRELEEQRLKEEQIAEEKRQRELEEKREADRKAQEQRELEEQRRKAEIARKAEEQRQQRELKELATLKGHTSIVNSLAFSPNGKTLASGSDDKTVKLWDAQTRRELATLKGHDDKVNSVAFSPDGKTLASGSSDGTVRLWDAQTRRKLATLKVHDFGVNSVAFSPDGETLASGSSAKIVKLWDAQTKRELATLKEDGKVYSVAFSPDGKMLASGSGQSVVKLWDAQTKQELATLYGRNSTYVDLLVFSPDGKTLTSSGLGSTIKLWDAQTNQELTTLELAVLIISLAFSPDGKTFASGSWDGTVRLWDAQTQRELATLKGHTCEVMSVAFSPNGKTFASGSRDGTVKLWE